MPRAEQNITFENAGSSYTDCGSARAAATPDREKRALHRACLAVGKGLTRATYAILRDRSIAL